MSVILQLQRLRRALTSAAVLAALVCATPLLVHAGRQPADSHAETAGQPQGEAQDHAAADAHGEEGEHGGGWDTIARLVNFGILAGALVYFLRTPLAHHLRDRAAGITSDLTAAAATQREAAHQLEEIDRRLAALPQELETLRQRGAAEVAAEDVRIRELADVERQRVLEHARREIDMHARIARRELTEHAAELATGLAARTLTQKMTPEDHLRLVDRFADQVQMKERP